MRYAAIALMLLALLALSPAAAAQPLAQATSTYTPMPTRTPAPSAATQSVVIVTVDQTPLTLAKTVSYGDVYIVVALAAIAAMLGIGFAYSWVKSHIRVQE